MLTRSFEFDEFTKHYFVHYSLFLPVLLIIISKGESFGETKRRKELFSCEVVVWIHQVVMPVPTSKFQPVANEWQ